MYQFRPKLVHQTWSYIEPGAVHTYKNRLPTWDQRCRSNFLERNVICKYAEPLADVIIDFDLLLLISSSLQILLARVM